MNWLNNSFYFSKLSRDELINMLYAYLTESYDRFNISDKEARHLWKELYSLLKEDRACFDRSVYYALRVQGTDGIYGSVKTTYWDRQSVLPVESLFGIDLGRIIPPGKKHIWHLGRFFITQAIPGPRISILKKMLFNAFYPVYTIGNGIIIAECDSKLVGALEKLNIQSSALASSIQYIGSTTIPICIQSEALAIFMSSANERYCDEANKNDSESFKRLMAMQ